MKQPKNNKFIFSVVTFLIVIGGLRTVLAGIENEKFFDNFTADAVVTEVNKVEIINGIRYILHYNNSYCRGTCRRLAQVTGVVSNLRDIVIPDHVTYEGNDYEVNEISAIAFPIPGMDPIHVQSVTLPSTIEFINFRAFANCPYLEALTFLGLDNNPYGGLNMFVDCYNLRTIVVPAGCRDQFMHCFFYVTFPGGCQIVEVP